MCTTGGTGCVCHKVEPNRTLGKTKRIKGYLYSPASPGLVVVDGREQTLKVVKQSGPAGYRGSRYNFCEMAGNDRIGIMNGFIQSL